MNYKTYNSIGVMSGTSLDGIDICYVRFDYDKNYSFEIIEAITFKYPERWKMKITKWPLLPKEKDLEKIRWLSMGNLYREIFVKPIFCGPINLNQP